MKICVAQVNTCVGNIDANVDIMLTEITQAKRRQVDLVIFPELALCGYPPEDLLLRTDFLERCEQAVERLSVAAAGIAILFGCPRRQGGVLYNAALVLIQQKIAYEYHKHELPNYGVFDEARYFSKGSDALVFRLTPQGPAIGVLICEDTWFSQPALKAQAAGAEVLISIHASPFAYNKEARRFAAYTHCSCLTQLPLLCCQTVGAQDDLVFDGGSKAFNSASELTFAAPYFVSASYDVDYDSQQRCFNGVITPEVSLEAKVYQGLVLGIRDYVTKNGFKRVYLGLSGGIDSSLTLALAVDALGLDRVTAVVMPSRFTSAASLDAVEQQRRLIPVELQELSIEPVFVATLATLAPDFGDKPWDKSEENIQARIRGLLLMALANKHQALVLNTSNKSEMAVGYSTLYGDMVGGFAALQDVPKTWVFRLARYRNSLSATIPESIIERPPSAELAFDQKDADTLPDYEVLDAIIERFVDQQQSIAEIIAAGFDAVVVQRMVGLILTNEYKRRQAPPGVKITARAFRRERRYPMTSGRWWAA